MPVDAMREAPAPPELARTWFRTREGGPMSGAGDIFIAAAEAAIEAGADRAVRVELGAEVLRAVADRRPALAQACAALDADPGAAGPLRTVQGASKISVEMHFKDRPSTPGWR